VSREKSERGGRKEKRREEKRREVRGRQIDRKKESSSS